VQTQQIGLSIISGSPQTFGSTNPTMGKRIHDYQFTSASDVPR